MTMGETAKSPEQYESEGFPLTAMQQGMLFESIEAAEGTGAYVEQLAGTWHEALDTALLTACLEDAASRHPALRTRFAWEGRTEARQIVEPRITLPVEELDWRAMSEEDRRARWTRLLLEDRQRGFQLDRAPLQRLTFVRETETLYRMIWSVHHAVIDGRSGGVAFREVLQEYDSRRRGETISFRDRPPFHEYAIALDRADWSEAAVFWREQLGSFAEPVHLPFPPPQAPGSNMVRPDTGGTEISARLDTAATAGLRDATQALGITMATLIQGAWALLLAKYSGRDDILFGATKSIRHLECAPEDGVGLYINTLPLRTPVPDEAVAGDWLRDLRDRWVALRAYEHTPLYHAAAVSGVPRGTPLFETVLVVENGDINTLIQGRNATNSSRHFAALERTPGLLTMAAYNNAELRLVLEFDPARVSDTLAANLMRHYQAILLDLAAHPEYKLSDIAWLSTDERHSLIEAAAAPPLPGPAPDPVHRQFERIAASRPEAVAVRQETASVTYADLDRRANQLAHHLIALGAQPNQPVGLCLTRSIDMITALLGILKAGAGYLPIDPGYPAAHMDYLVGDAGVSIIVTRAETLPPLNSSPRLVCLDRDAAAITSQPASPPDTPAQADHLAYVIYTSGSTGKPKGVMIEHEAIARFTAAARHVYDISAADRVLQFASISFDAACEEIWPCLTAGGELVLRTDDMLASTQAFLHYAARWGVTVLDLPTAFWHVLAGELHDTAFPESVRLTIIGGEAARTEALAAWRAHVPASVRLMNTYGPTETTVVATCTPLDETTAGVPPIGRPLPGLSAYVMDSRRRLVPPGVPGELCIGGAQVARGYLGRPDLTERVFCPDPCRPEARMYCTGDRVVQREDGQLLFLGRFDDQVKIRGFRVELGEIEAVLGQCPGVREAAVAVREDGTGAKQLAGYIVPAASGAPAALVEAARAWLRDRLPAHMRPVVLTVLDALPHTTSGKIDRRALPTPVFGDSAETCGARTHEMDDFERRLAEIWARVLHVPQVGPDDNFFELGGSSLAAIVLLGQIERAFGKRLPTVHIYQAPTVRQLAPFVRGETQDDDLRALHIIQKGGAKRPLFFIGSTDILDPILPLLGEDQPVYSLNIFGLQRMDGKVPDLRLDAIAAKYLNEIRRIQPDGPYLLAAYCRDSMLMLELAQQINAAGARVARAISIDFFWEAQPRYNLIRRHVRNIRTFGWIYMFERLRRRVIWAKEQFYRLRSRTALRLFPRLRENVPASHHTSLFINAYYDAVLAYRPQPYDGVVTVLLASEWGIEDLPEWRRIARGGVEIRQIEACHYNLWKPPQSNVLAKAIRQCLDDSAAR